MDLQQIKCYLNIELFQCSFESSCISREIRGHRIVQKYQLLVHYFNLLKIKRNLYVFTNFDFRYYVYKINFEFVWSAGHRKTEPLYF